MREFAWHPHQGNYPGWLWTATTGSFVGYESLLERDRVLLADFDPAVVGIVSQPFWISGRDEACGEVRRRHAPDYLLSLRDGCHVVVGVKPAADDEARPPFIPARRQDSADRGRSVNASR
ncbi:hypothetical protein BA895_06100 [Humibacillus sp. DSM 29435]|nr:hypothetical protein BA895_06100 [Humibacillus sp. DSM 29435]